MWTNVALDQPFHLDRGALPISPLNVFRDIAVKQLAHGSGGPQCIAVGHGVSPLGNLCEHSFRMCSRFVRREHTVFPKGETSRSAFRVSVLHDVGADAARFDPQSKAFDLSVPDKHVGGTGSSSVDDTLREPRHSGSPATQASTGVLAQRLQFAVFTDLWSPGRRGRQIAIRTSIVLLCLSGGLGGWTEPGKHQVSRRKRNSPHSIAHGRILTDRDILGNSRPEEIGVLCSIPERKTTNLGVVGSNPAGRANT